MIDRLSLGSKLVAVGVAISTLIVIVGSLAYYSEKTAQNEYSFIIEKTVPKIQLVSELNLDYRQVRIALRTLGLAGLSAADVANATKDVQASIAKYEDANSAYVALGFIDGQKGRYERVNKTWIEFKAVGEQVLKLQMSGRPEDHEKMLSIFLHDCPEKAKSFSDAIEELTTFHKGVMASKVRSAQESTAKLQRVVWTFIFIAVCLGLGLALAMSISVSRAIKAVAASLVDNVNQVSGTVSDLTASSEAMSQAATEQAASIQETAASVEEIRAMVHRNTESTAESAKLSAQSKEQAGAGQNAVRDMIEAMKEITSSNKSIENEVAEGNRRISEIVDVIKEIESKTKVINEIVFQTKLLSFNASVEAARAGEHGKGFAVVAEEVGNLASMSGGAAKDIGDLLSKSIQKVNAIVEETTSRVQHLVEEASGKLERGGHVAQVCAETLGKIVTNANELSLRVENISSASVEQSSGISEIGRSIQLLNQSTQVNSTETSNTAAAATHLGKQVDSLNSAIYRLQKLVTGGASGGVGRIVNAFVWRQRYSLGVDAMDDEHRILIGKINTLVGSINEEKDLSTLKAHFTDLAKYTQEHFSHEEAYMSSIGYPYLSNHQKIHHNLLAKVAEFGKSFDDGSMDSNALVTFLNDWLIKHILGVDMRYAKFSRGESNCDTSLAA